MAISYVGGQVAGRTDANGAPSITFTLTGGSDSTPLADDLVIVTVVTGTVNNSPAMAITTPSGYTALGQLFQNSSSDTALNVSYKVMGGTPDTAVTLPASTSNQWGQGYAIMVFRGVDITTPMDVTPVSAGATGTARPDPASITPVTSGAWTVVCGGGASTSPNNYTAPADYTTNFITAVGTDTMSAMVGMGYNSSPSTPEDPASFTGGATGTSDTWASYTIALRPDEVSIIGDGYRVLENETDFRITENSDVRIPENFTASGSGGTLVGVASLIATPKAVYKMAGTLLGEGSLVAVGRLGLSTTQTLTGTSSLIATPTVIPFSSTIYINVAGVWKEAQLFVKRNNIWAAPMSQAYKVAGLWKRVY